MNSLGLAKYALLLNQTLSDRFEVGRSTHRNLEDSIQTMFPNVLWFKLAWRVLTTPNVIVLVGMVLVEMALVVMGTDELTGMLPVSIYWISSGSRMESGMSINVFSQQLL